MLKQGETPTVFAQPAPEARQQAGEAWGGLDVPKFDTPQEGVQEARAGAEQLKAEQAAAQARAQQEAVARARAEQEAVHAQAEQEEAARKMAAEQAKTFAEAEKRAKKQAEAEAKAKAKAEAKALAREKAEAKAREREAKQRAKSRTPSARVRSVRRGSSFSLGKAIFLLLVLAVGAVASLPYTWSYIWPKPGVISSLEKELSAQLGQPVHIQDMEVELLPKPNLLLKSVSAGNGLELKMESLAIYFNYLKLASNIKEIDQIEAKGVIVNAGAFSHALSLLKESGANGKYPVKQVVLRGLQFTGDVPPLQIFRGKVRFDEYGKISKAEFYSEDGQLNLTLQPQEHRWNVDVAINDSGIPLFPSVKFARLDAAGVISDGKVTFPTISGNMYGGSVSGSVSVAWQDGWQMQGTLRGETLLLQQLLPGMSMTGELDGEAEFGMASSRLSQLASTAHMDVTFQAKDGEVSGLDVTEMARSQGRQLVGGSTHFDSMSGNLRADSGGQHLRSVKMVSGGMVVSGSVEARADGGLAGQFVVDMNKVRAGMGTFPVSLGGTASAPQWGVGGKR